MCYLEMEAFDIFRRGHTSESSFSFLPFPFSRRRPGYGFLSLNAPVCRRTKTFPFYFMVSLFLNLQSCEFTTFLMLFPPEKNNV
ncbi:Uncharacterized protein APZ42_016524 [Daphnia magna]|uniref:Uncharacterized protein n=1 Tax=Daphnia magna TaxID=35525 RepID=A0A165AGZ8_9CRUS|nr:Uncharacterized protein APZ42_016524 [Daphnia magna]